MALHPPIESFTFAKSSRFLDNSTPALIDQVWENISSPEIRRIKGQCEDVGAAHTFYKRKSNSSGRQRGSIGTGQHRALYVRLR